MAEINLFLIFLGSIGFDLLIGDPSFVIHPVQVIGFYTKKISDYLIKNIGENKNILYWGGLFVALSTIGMSFGLGKLIELSYVQSGNNFFSGLLISSRSISPAISFTLEISPLVAIQLESPKKINNPTKK